METRNVPSTMRHQPSRRLAEEPSEESPHPEQLQKTRSSPPRQLWVKTRKEKTSVLVGSGGEMAMVCERGTNRHSSDDMWKREFIRNKNEWCT